MRTASWLNSKGKTAEKTMDKLAKKAERTHLRIELWESLKSSLTRLLFTV